MYSYLFRGTLCTPGAGNVDNIERLKNKTIKEAGYEDNKNSRRLALLKEGSNVDHVLIELDSSLENIPRPGEYIMCILSVFCTPVTKSSGDIQGLVLKLCDDTQGHFRRIGSFGGLPLHTCGLPGYGPVFKKVVKETYVSTAAAEGATSSFMEGSEHEETAVQGCN